MHPIRPLTVVLDEDVATGNDPQHRYLRRLLDAADATVWRYGDNGPPDTSRVLTAPHTPARYAPGWIELRRSGLAYDATLANENGARLASAWPGFQDIYQVAPALGGTGTAAERVKDLLAACAATAASTDAFVTTRPALLRTTSAVARQANPQSPADALSLIGLHLRSQDRYVVGTEGDPMFAVSEFNRGLFYLVTTRTLLPGTWPWFSACIDTGDDALALLAQSVIERVDRTLRLRDTLYRWLMLPQNNDTADETLATLDMLMLTLHGAFDAAARVAHRAMALPGKDSTVAWHRQDWLTKVDKAGHGSVIDPVRPGTAGHALLTIIRSLRNTVHGQATSSVAVHGQHAHGDTDTQLALPADDVDHMLVAIDTLGMRESWGISEFAPTRLLIRPAPFVEQIMSPAYALLNTLLERTPVHLLLDGRSPSRMTAPTEDATFDPLIGQRLLWQLGL